MAFLFFFGLFCLLGGVLSVWRYILRTPAEKRREREFRDWMQSVGLGASWGPVSDLALDRLYLYPGLIAMIAGLLILSVFLATWLL